MPSFLPRPYSIHSIMPHPPPPKGLAVFIEPDDVVLPPFGVVDVTLEAVADLWGCYEDALVCIIVEEDEEEESDEIKKGKKNR